MARDRRPADAARGGRSAADGVHREGAASTASAIVAFGSRAISRCRRRSTAPGRAALATLRPGEGTALGDAIALAIGSASSSAPATARPAGRGPRHLRRRPAGRPIRRGPPRVRREAAHVPVCALVLGTAAGTVEAKLPGGLADHRVPPDPARCAARRGGGGEAFFESSSNSEPGARLGEACTRARPPAAAARADPRVHRPAAAADAGRRRCSVFWFRRIPAALARPRRARRHTPAVAALSPGAAPTPPPPGCKGLQRLRPVRGPSIIVPGRLAPLHGSRSRSARAARSGYVVGGLAAPGERQGRGHPSSSARSAVPSTRGSTTSRTALFLDDLRRGHAASIAQASGPGSAACRRTAAADASPDGTEILPRRRSRPCGGATTVRVQPRAQQRLLRGLREGRAPRLRLGREWASAPARPPDPELAGRRLGHARLPRRPRRRVRTPRDDGRSARSRRSSRRARSASRVKSASATRCCC